MQVNEKSKLGWANGSKEANLQGLNGRIYLGAGVATLFTELAILSNKFNSNL